MAAEGERIAYTQIFDFALDLPDEVWSALFETACAQVKIKDARLVAASGRNAIITLKSLPDDASFKRLMTVWADLLRQAQNERTEAAFPLEIRALAQEIEHAWSDDVALRPLVATGLAHRAARVAALRAIPEQRARGRLALVDEVSGLPLPVPLRTPYQQRGTDEHGRRREIIAHLQHEYGDYLDAGLFTTGFLFENDRPAYNALNYKAARAVSDEGRDETIADYCLRHRILTREHILSPPRKYSRQVELLRRVQAK